MSEIITIILVLLTLLIIYCLYKMLDKRGLYFGLVMLNLISFVLSFKISDPFKMNINVGIIPLIATFTIIYIFLIKYTAKETKNLLIITLCSNIVTALLIAVMNSFIPAVEETISINIKGTFSSNYKILIFYPIIILLSQFVTIKLFELLRTIQDNIPVCIILTYIITGLIYTLLSYVISYIEVLTIRESLFLGVSTYIIGIAITIINIVFIHTINKKKVIK